MKLPIALLAGLLGTTASVALHAADAREAAPEDGATRDDAPAIVDARPEIVALSADGGAPPPRPKPIDDCPPCGRG